MLHTFRRISYSFPPIFGSYPSEPGFPSVLLMIYLTSYEVTPPNFRRANRLSVTFARSGGPFLKNYSLGLRVRECWPGRRSGKLELVWIERANERKPIGDQFLRKGVFVRRHVCEGSCTVESIKFDC